MIICNYTTDLGAVFNRYRPRINGLDLTNNRLIPVDEVLLIASNYVPIDGYETVGDKEGVCNKVGKSRVLVMQFDSKLLELEYYEPFTQLDWSVFNTEEVRVETIPEFIHHGDLDIALRRI